MSSSEVGNPVLQNMQYSGGEVQEDDSEIDQHVDIEMQDLSSPNIQPEPTAADFSDDESTDSESSDEEDDLKSKPKDPKDEQRAKLGRNIVILVFVVGVCAGVINGCVQLLNGIISKSQAQLLMVSNVGPFYLLLTTTFLCGLSAYIIKVGAEPGSTGSGMAEVKALMVSDFHPTEFPKLVSLKIMAVRIGSLVTAAGAGLSIGLAAPIVHSTVCFAYSLMKFIPDFGDLMEHPTMMKQVFAASAAVGFSSIQNTPIGGLLFSIEVTSAYYLISNYWRSFMAATAGAVMYSLIGLSISDEGEGVGRLIDIDPVYNPFTRAEYSLCILLGAICGVLGLYYMKLQQAWFLFVKPYTLKHPVATAAAAGCFTALMIYASGAYSDRGVGPGVVIRDCLTDGYISEMGKYGVAPVGGLIASLIIRVILTVLGTTMRISAGIFICQVAIGAQLGRIFGLIVQACVWDGTSVYVGGYAMVGAVAFSSATTHTVSAAVILIELTGEFDMILPCLIGAVIGCGITKSRSLSLYDQGMVNKGLESFELLMQGTSGFHVASDVMDKKVIAVPCACTMADLFKLLENLKQSTFPVIDSTESCKLVGSVKRHDVFIFIKDRFERVGLSEYVRTTLPVDHKLDQVHNERLKKIEARKAWIQKGTLGVGGLVINTPPGSEPSSEHHHQGTEAEQQYIRRGLFPSPYQLRLDEVDEEGRPVHRKRSKLHGLYSALHSAANIKKMGDTVNPLFSAFTGHTPVPSTNGRETAARAAEATQANEEERKRNAVLIDAMLQSVVDISNEALLPINVSPFTAHRSTSMDQLYVLFEMVKVHCVFVVTDDKTLEGMISKDHLLQCLRKKVK